MARAYRIALTPSGPVSRHASKCNKRLSSCFDLGQLAHVRGEKGPRKAYSILLTPARFRSRSLSLPRSLPPPLLPCGLNFVPFVRISQKAGGLVGRCRRRDCSRASRCTTPTRRTARRPPCSTGWRSPWEQRMGLSRYKRRQKTQPCRLPSCRHLLCLPRGVF